MPVKISSDGTVISFPLVCDHSSSKELSLFELFNKGTHAGGDPVQMNNIQVWVGLQPCRLHVGPGGLPGVVVFGDQCLLAALVLDLTCVDQDRSDEIVTPRYFTELTTEIGLSSMKSSRCTGDFALVMGRTFVLAALSFRP